MFLLVQSPPKITHNETRQEYFCVSAQQILHQAISDGSMALGHQLGEHK